MQRNIKERFEEKYEMVPECGCWIWTAATHQGYGEICYKGKKETAHRVSWELHNGPIPHGLWVLHRCDTRECVNPKHLFLGTQLDNIADCVKKGRNTHAGRTRLYASNAERQRAYQARKKAHIEN